MLQRFLMTEIIFQQKIWNMKGYVMQGLQVPFRKYSGCYTQKISYVTTLHIDFLIDEFTSRSTMRKNT